MRVNLGRIGLLWAGALLLPQAATAAIFAISGTINQDQTWLADHTYFISGNLDLQAQLTIQPGTVIKLGDYSELNVGAGGKIIAQGRPELEIIFTCRDDNAWGETIALGSGPPQGQDWTIKVGQDSTFQFCRFIYGGVALRSSSNSNLIKDNMFCSCQVGILAEADLEIENCLFTGCQAGIAAPFNGGLKLQIRGCTIDNAWTGINGGYDNEVTLENVLFTSCYYGIFPIKYLTAAHNAFYNCAFTVNGGNAVPAGNLALAQIPYAHQFCLQQNCALIDNGAGLAPCGYTTDQANEDGSTRDIGFHYALLKSSIYRHGITWRFDVPHWCGTYVNGDWWVIGPVRVAGILRDNQAILQPDTAIGNGTQINPAANYNFQGYDSRCTIPYQSALNRGDQFLVQPASGSPQSVVSVCSCAAKTADQWNKDVYSYLRDGAVLTVIHFDDRPSLGDFRPAYVGANKPPGKNFSQVGIDPNGTGYRRLGKFPPAAATDLPTVEKYFERVWLEHIWGWQSTDTTPINNLPGYGETRAQQIVLAGIYLNLNFSAEQKKTLLINYLQYAIDLYALVAQGGLRTFYHDGGHANGRKLAIMMAGAIFDDPEMLAVAHKSGDYSTPNNLKSDHIWFGEDDQTFYVDPNSVSNPPLPYVFSGTYNFQAYGNCTILSNCQRDNLDYTWHHTLRTLSGKTMPEWGIAHLGYPSMDNAIWDPHSIPGLCADSHYRQVVGSNLVGEALAARMTARNDPELGTDPNGLKAIWNHDALFDYADRYFSISGARSFETSIYQAYHNGSTLGSKWADTVGYQIACVNPPAQLNLVDPDGINLIFWWNPAVGAGGYRVICFPANDRDNMTLLGDQLSVPYIVVTGLPPNQDYVFRVFSLAAGSLIQSIHGPAGVGWAETSYHTQAASSVSAVSKVKGRSRGKY